MKVTRYKIKIDNRTTITVRKKEQIQKWLDLYPKAEVREVQFEEGKK